MFKPEGILPALVTPFTDDARNVSEERLRSLVNHCVNLGVNGVLVCGTTGEFVNMTIDEKKQAIDIVIDEISSNMPVLVGTGGSGTDEALAMTKYSKDAGADAALIVTPFYLKPSDRGVYEHYYTISEEVDLPIVLYNIPQCTGVQLSWQMVEDLAQIENIIGLKDSSGQLGYILAILEKVRDKINVLCGNDEVVVAALAAGCAGAILASANVIPDIWVSIYNNVKDGELGKARELQYSIQKIARIIARSGAVGTKAALNMMKTHVGPVRKPLSEGGELTYEAREELRIELEKIGRISSRSRPIKIEKRTLKERLNAIEVTSDRMEDIEFCVGEALAGEGAEVAHIDLLIGRKDGLLAAAFAKAKAAPTPGHEPMLAILEPNLAVKPETLIVPTVTIRSMRQASMVYGPAQAAVAKAVVDSVADKTIDQKVAERLIIIANVFVHPTAIDRQRVYINNYKAMRHSIRKAVEGRPTITELIDNKERSKHPFKFTP